MAGPRLPFLWPVLFKSETPAMRSVRAAARMRALHSTGPRQQQEMIAQRYGSANEPPPHLGGGGGGAGGGGAIRPPSKQGAASEQTKLPKIGDKLQHDGEEEVKADRGEKKTAESDKRATPTTVDGSLARSSASDPILDAADSSPFNEAPGSPRQLDNKPLDSVLDSVAQPAQQQYQQQESQPTVPEDLHPDVSVDEHAPPIKAPHIETPRHVHHFDTYVLVKRLADSGWTESQAITSMKAVRLMLADNMDLAREALVSKSNVENETYLFRAACAELKTEITARRKAEQEKMRTERTQLQHEVDILGQRLGQEGASMKDELKGMFDDRKMAVRNEQRGMESKVQQLNYKITVSLQADARSEVEGLRWVMTRRVIITLGVIVVMVIGSLRLYSNALHEQELDAKRRANMRSGGTQTDQGSGEFVGENGGRREREGRLMGGGEMLVKDGENVQFVSLG